MSSTPPKSTGAALVLGGGAAGVRCSLDLAEAGYKVYLVEKNIALGGHVSQLDKVFPYNKCSVCTLTPKLKEVAQNPNIEVLTNAELTALEGEAGAFTAFITRHPSFVDPVVCTTCGDCVVACPVVLPNWYNDRLNKRKAIGKLYQHAVPNHFAVTKSGHSPCKRACPVHTSAQGYIDLIAAGRFAEAYAVASEPNPFSAVCGRICDHECETACTRGEVDEPIAIADLKRFVADWATENVLLPTPVEVRYTEKIAVVGAGPAGLTAARELAGLGYQTTVFEAQAEPGGMLRYGIPEFRLPKAALRQDIDRVLALGVDLQCNKRAGADFTVDGLLGDGYKAVFIATGLQTPRPTRLPGDDRSGVLQALDVLRATAAQTPPTVGQRVVVVGNDDTALDTARTCLRLGAAAVTVVCSNDVTAAPTDADQQAAAAEEHIEIAYSLLPVEVLGDDRVTGVRFQRCNLGEPDEHGMRQPQLVENEFLVIDCDTAIFANGRTLTEDFIQGCEGLLLSSGQITVDRDTMMTTRESVFAGGDAASNGRWTAIEAIAAGRRAARSIHNYLRGEVLVPLDDSLMKEAKPAAHVLAQTAVKMRARMPQLAPSAASLTFAEVNLGFSADQAIAEAKRCLDCAVCGECMACERVCHPGALRHGGRDQDLQRQIGAVVVAAGFDGHDLSRHSEFGYGRYANVISSFGYERLLSPNGPTFGELTRPSDGAHPKKIAFIQPVDPEDPHYEACVSVCSMYATKESMLARDHVAAVECAVFSSERRPIGKGFESFYQSALARGVRYIPAQPSAVREDPATGDLLVHWQDEQGRHHADRYDMVVLAVALQPPHSAPALAATLGISLNDDGFCATQELAPVVTSRDGVFVAGTFSGPKDIPSSMAQASAAAAHVMMTLADSRGSVTAAAKKLPPERDVSAEAPRLGVFVCRCESERPNAVDVDETTRSSSTLPDVVYATAVDYACHPDGLALIRAKIAEHQLNRVVVAGCSPRTKEPAFQGALRQAGLNPFLVEIANIREHVSWAHASEPEAATAKAQDLVRMAAARARLLQPLQRHDASFTQTALVIGGGVAGMTAALAVASMGYPVHIIERSARLGGHALDPDISDLSLLAQSHAHSLERQITQHPLITVHLDTELAANRGFVGNFSSVLEATTTGERTTLEHGVVIVASGAREDRPDLYGLGKSPFVVTQADLARMLAENSFELEGAHNVGMILCGGSHDESTPCCSRTSCGQAVTNALALKEHHPDRQVTVWHKEAHIFGLNDDDELLLRAAELGVTFKRYSAGYEPRATFTADGVTIASASTLGDESAPVGLDLLVLTTPTVPNDGTAKLADLLRVPRGNDGFFLITDRNLHPDVNLRPVDFTREGIFLCGAAEYPKSLDETISQAYATAGRAAGALATATRKVGGSVSEVDQDTCIACLTCTRVCPIGVPIIDPVAKKAMIEPTICKGCGICVSQCPVKAITLHHYTDAQIIATEEALFMEVN
jgi:heterodisulfide reductase subunit A-like polyferredoxin